jgi:hypothetical protein
LSFFYGQFPIRPIAPKFNLIIEKKGDKKMKKNPNSGKGEKTFSNKKHSKSNRFILWTLTFLLIVGVGTVIFSQSAGNRKMEIKTNVKQDGKKYVPTQAITRDETTGKLRKPTPQETEELVRTLKKMTNRSSEGMSEERLSNGAVRVNIAGSFAPVMLAKPNADGTTETRCVTTFEEAAAFLGLVEKGSDTE